MLLAVGAKLRLQMRTEIKKLHQRVKTTFIYVTHDQTEAMTMGDRIVVMKDGKIQQTDTPQEIYRSPINMFVAGFIGSPAMNFLKGTLLQEGTDVYFISGTDKIQIPKKQSANILKNTNNGVEIILGIRPEFLHDEILFLESVSNAHFSAEIEVIENMGSEIHLYLKGFDNQPITAKVNARTSYTTGKQVTLAIDMNKALFFDPKTECVIG